MKLFGSVGMCFLLCVFCDLPQPVHANGQEASSVTQTATAKRDGAHDFDFEMGTWKIHLSRLQDRLVGSKTWVEFDGTFSRIFDAWVGFGDL